MAKVKVSTSKGPDPKSKRSAKRKTRSFKSVELSTRKGRRNAEKQAIACTIGRDRLQPGEERALAPNGYHYKAGGSNNFH